ncbi:hypothetical protein PMAYCL1PPCAC_22966, partial [Pristionchus mayeri]
GMLARLSHRHSEEVFDEENELLSPVFSPSLQHLQQPGRRCSSSGQRRDSASKQHLVFVPPPARVSPPSSLSSPTGARHRWTESRRGGVSCSSCRRTHRLGSTAEGGLQQQRRSPEMLQLRGSATSEKVSSSGNVGSPKQLLSLSSSFQSSQPRRLSAHALKEKETLALRSPPLVKPIDNWCVYCYQVVCSLYEVGGMAPPRVDEGGEWSGHVMIRGGHYECHRLRDCYRNPQCA